MLETPAPQAKRSTTCQRKCKPDTCRGAESALCEYLLGQCGGVDLGDADDLIDGGYARKDLGPAVLAH